MRGRAGTNEQSGTLDVPFRVEPGANANELVAVWRYADAKWIDAAGEWIGYEQRVEGDYVKPAVSQRLAQLRPSGSGAR